MGKVIFLDSKDEGIKMYRDDKKNLLELIKLILYFANNTTTNLYITKLNKLLFYTQFYYYKINNERLIADDFICDYYGPVIPDIDQYLKLFTELGFIKLESTEYGKIVVPKIRIKKDDYEKDEKKVLHKVLNKFDDYTSRQVSNYSHRESLWKDTKIKNIISIERAQELNDF